MIARLSTLQRFQPSQRSMSSSDFRREIFFSHRKVDMDPKPKESGNICDLVIDGV